MLQAVVRAALRLVVDTIHSAPVPLLEDQTAYLMITETNLMTLVPPAPYS